MPLAQDYPSEADIEQQRATKKLTADDVELLNRFRSHAQSFATAYNQLIRDKQRVLDFNVPQLVADYNLLINRGSNLANTVEAVSLGVNNAMQKLRAQWGDDFIEQDVREYTTSVLGQLGMNPMIWYMAGGIGVSAAVTALLGWMASRDSFTQKLEAVDDYKKKNPDATQEDVIAYVTAIDPDKKPLFGNNVLTWIIVAGVAYWLFFRS